MIGNYVFAETSPAAAGTAASSNPVGGGPQDSSPGVAYPLADYDTIEIEAELAGATGGTLDVYMQSNDVATGTWYDVVHFPQLLAAAGAIIYRTSLSRYATGTVAPVVIGKNLSPVLAVNISLQNGFGDRLRMVMVAGSGTSAGAVLSVKLTGFRAETRQK